ncbi:MAG TPA: gamma-glutamylcyclotransferase family protein [Gemmataceae bacterium]|nr:gamma-glutamylcyclotransferase family protein [Gemmataceae bacterium]
MLGTSTSSASGINRLIETTTVRHLHLDLSPGDIAIFGFGSLMSRPSLELTIGHPYSGPFLTCGLRGWQRRWNVATPNTLRFYAIRDGNPIYPNKIVYLNICPSPDCVVNGVLFVITKPELSVLDSRESIYDRIDVGHDLAGVDVSGNQVFAYIGKPEYQAIEPWTLAENGIRTSYIRTIEAGLAELGSDFRHNYLRTTVPPSSDLVFDDHRIVAPTV